MTTTAVQTTMTNAPAAGAPGLLYDSEGLHDVIEKVATEDIPFGAYVAVTENGCELPDSSAEVTGAGRGIALLDPSKPSGTGYKAGDIVAVLQKGRVWVQTETAMTAYVAPFVRFTASGANTPGGFRNDDDTTKAAQPTGVRMFTSVGAAGLAVVELT